MYRGSQGGRRKAQGVSREINCSRWLERVEKDAGAARGSGARGHLATSVGGVHRRRAGIPSSLRSSVGCYDGGQWPSLCGKGKPGEAAGGDPRGNRGAAEVGKEPEVPTRGTCKEREELRSVRQALAVDAGHRIRSEKRAGGWASSGSQSQRDRSESSNQEDFFPKFSAFYFFCFFGCRTSCFGVVCWIARPERQLPFPPSTTEPRAAACRGVGGYGSSAADGVCSRNAGARCVRTAFFNAGGCECSVPGESVGQRRREGVVVGSEGAVAATLVEEQLRRVSAIRSAGERSQRGATKRRVWRGVPASRPEVPRVLSSGAEKPAPADGE